MLLSAVSVLVVAQSSSEIPEGLMNNPVYVIWHFVLCVVRVSSDITNMFSCHVTDDEFGEKSVCVLLDGEESELTFVDHPSSEMSVSISLFKHRNFQLLVFLPFIEPLDLRSRPQRCDASYLLPCPTDVKTIPSHAL